MTRTVVPMTGIKIENYSAKILDTTLYFQFYNLGGRQLVIWVGDSEKLLSSLHIAFPSIDKSKLTATCLLGPLDAPGGDVSAKLSQRLEVPVFFSYNVQDPDPNVLLFAQTVILSYLEKNTETFSTLQKVTPS